MSARSALSYDVCLRHKAWDDRLLYKVYERRPRSQCVVVNGRERLYACHVVMCRRNSPYMKLNKGRYSRMNCSGQDSN